MTDTRSSYSLPLGAAVSTAFGVYLRNLLPFSLLAALVLAPALALQYVELTGEADLPVVIGRMILNFLLSYVLAGALTYGVVQQMRGKPAGMAEALTMGLQTFFLVLGTALLASLRILIGFLLLLVPGIIEGVRLYVAIPAAVMEGKAPTAAIGRSIGLTAGSRGTIFGAALIVMLVLTFVLGLLWGFVATALRPSQGVLVAGLLLIALVTSTLNAVLPAVFYAMLRQGKENVDIAQQAAVFD
jgi:hypothetical protein